MTVDPRRQQILREELERRQSLRATKIDLTALSFPPQARFIQDPSKRKAALCTRRAGKTHGTAIMLVQTALQKPGTTSLFLSYTRKTARMQIEQPIARLLHKLNIKSTFNKTDLEFTLENQSKISLLGLDTHGTDNKLRGPKYALAVVDECGHGQYAIRDTRDGTDRLYYVIYEVLEPAIAQYEGTIALIGSPGLNHESLFYQITSPNPTAPGWSVHHWSWEENTSTENRIRICDGIRRTLEARLQTDPEYQTTDGYRREWKGEWAIDQNALVYRFDPLKNLTPSYPPTALRRILSVDLGSNDATAFVIAAADPYDPTLYIIHSEKHQHLDFTQVAQITKSLAQKYGPIARYVIDGQNKQGVDEIKNRHHIPFTGTPKSPNYKYSAIQLMNGDFGTQNIKLLAHENQQLINEYRTLTWDDKNPTRENQTQKNDLADAALYAYINARAWMTRSPQETASEPQRLQPIQSKTLEQLNQDQINIFEYYDILGSIKNL